jgi:hypothetical protein
MRLPTMVQGYLLALQVHDIRAGPCPSVLNVRYSQAKAWGESESLTPSLSPPPLETVSQCHSEAIAEESRLRNHLNMRDASLCSA